MKTLFSLWMFSSLPYGTLTHQVYKKRLTSTDTFMLILTITLPKNMLFLKLWLLEPFIFWIIFFLRKKNPTQLRPSWPMVIQLVKSIRSFSQSVILNLKILVPLPTLSSKFASPYPRHYRSYL